MNLSFLLIFTFSYIVQSRNRLRISADHIRYNSPGRWKYWTTNQNSNSTKAILHFHKSICDSAIQRRNIHWVLCWNNFQQDSGLVWTRDLCYDSWSHIFSQLRNYSFYCRQVWKEEDFSNVLPWDVFNAYTFSFLHLSNTRRSRYICIFVCSFINIVAKYLFL